MPLTTSTSLPAPVQQSFNMKLLSVPTPNFIHSIPAMKERMPRNGGTTMRFRRYNPLPSSLVPLGPSGVTIPPVNLTAIDIDAKIDFYGQWVGINEQVTLQNQENVLNECALRLGVSLRQTEDELIRNMLLATAAAIDCVFGLNADDPTNVTLPDIKIMTTSLLDNNAYMFLSGIDGEDKFGSAPVRNSYFGLCSTALTPSLEVVPTFIYQTNYPNPMEVLDSEWGTIGNIRFLVSSIGAVEPNASANGQDVYDIFVVGKEAYACIEQDGYSAQFIYLPAQFSGPLALNVSVGWKMAMVPRITNDAWCGRLRCTLIA